MPAVITLTQVTRLYGRFAALRQVSAEFFSGKLYVILGENGAGKTTLLRLIAGLCSPTSGRVEVLASGPKSVAAKLAFMGHASMLYDEMTAEENLRHAASLYSQPRRSFQDLLSLVALDPPPHRRVSDYSQGMRQRLSLARTLVHDPEILLLDEPFSNLDPDSAKSIAALLAGLRDRGKTLLVVTHQPGYLAPVADEQLWMAGGEIVRRVSQLQEARI